jgi:sterol desaturase/sphingolipid hydroxylase (fatty acid hydroxylase superfamily)
MLTLAVLVAMIAVAYVNRHSGVPIPWPLTTVVATSGGGDTHTTAPTLDLWGALVNDTPTPDFVAILTTNLTLWVCLYTIAYVLLYLPPVDSVVQRWKLNPARPPTSLVVMEILRSVRSVVVASGYELLIHQLFASGTYEPPLCLAVLKLRSSDGVETEIGTDASLAPLATVVIAGLVVYLWGDAHFYWTHRLLHTPWLYKNVHKYHHQSYNPDPFSGLSMHWFEHLVYFSAAPMAALAAPLWLCRIMLKGLLVFPLQGHSGFGSWESESSYNHYIHHATFNWNFGSSPVWDTLMGTNWVKPKGARKKGTHSATSSREQAASTQAAEVGVSSEVVGPESE